MWKYEEDVTVELLKNIIPSDIKNIDKYTEENKGNVYKKHQMYLIKNQKYLGVFKKDKDAYRLRYLDDKLSGSIKNKLDLPSKLMVYVGSVFIVGITSGVLNSMLGIQINIYIMMLSIIILGSGVKKWKETSHETKEVLLGYKKEQEELLKKYKEEYYTTVDCNKLLEDIKLKYKETDKKVEEISV